MPKRLVAVVLALALVVACTQLSRRVRRHTYPPDFQFIEREDLTGTMAELAAYVHDLDHVVRDPAKSEAERRDQTLRILEAMEGATERLGTEGWRSNHPLIDANLERFRRDIRLAHDNVEADPPSYVLAGAVTGACVYCHDGARR